MKELINSKAVKISIIVLIGVLFETFIFTNLVPKTFILLPIITYPISLISNIIPVEYKTVGLGWVIFIISLSLVTFFFIQFYKYLKNKKWKTYLKQLFFFSIFYPIFICSIIALIALAKVSSFIVFVVAMAIASFLTFFMLPSIFIYNITMIIRDKNYGVSLSLISSILSFYFVI